MLLGVEIVEVLPQVVGQFGVLGVLIWYLFYTTTKTLPELNRVHNEQVERIVGAHDEATKEITTKFTKTLEVERGYRQQELNELKEHILETGCKWEKGP